MHPARLSTDELLPKCVVRALRRGGPGGQHRNKVETAVVIEHTPTGLRAEASERRSQSDNRHMAIMRLRMLLALEHREYSEVTEGRLEPASPLWRSRACGTRIDVSTEHDDFPAILAELLDGLHALAFDMSQAGKHFEVTSSQLVSLLRAHPPALTLVNTKRIELGLHRLR
jgi:RF-1 domain